MILRSLIYIIIACAACSLKAEELPMRYGIAMHGEPKFKSASELSFRHISPSAPKAGVLRQSVIGTFDTLNPFIVRGTPAPYIRGYVVESLMARALDEPFSIYGLLAETVTMPEDRSSITFHLHPKARFSNGTPVLADDVIASFEFLKSKGRPNFRTSFIKVESIRRISERAVSFHFPNANDRELPLILGLLPVLPKDEIEKGTFSSTILSPFVASGPYLIEQVKPGQSIVLQKNPEWWGKDLPINSGIYNFNTINMLYFRDSNVAFESFKAGNIDIRIEDDPNRWSNGYNFAAYKNGQVQKLELMTGLPKPMVGFVFNTRKPPFNDINTRKAITHLYNFEWINENLYNGIYRRTQSFFEGSELSSVGIPASDEEKLLLNPHLNSVTKNALEGKHIPPVMSSSGKDRAHWHEAKKLFESAGYRHHNSRIVNIKTGQPLTFEIIVNNKEHEKNSVSFVAMLRSFGIQAQVRLVDSAQFERRRQNFEFDIIPFSYASSLSPGNEQIFRWGSQNAAVKGSFNLAGLQSPAADEMINTFLHAKNRTDFIHAVRALDRVLISSYSLLPLYHAPTTWVAHWHYIGVPQKPPLLGFAPETLWRK